MKKKLQIVMSDDSWMTLENLTKEANDGFVNGSITFSDVVNEILITAKLDIKGLQAKHTNIRKSLRLMAAQKEIDIEKSVTEKEDAIKNQDFEKAANLRDKEKLLKEEFESIKEQWRACTCNAVSVVDEEDIAKVVSRWTGIPVSKMLESEQDELAHMEKDTNPPIHMVADPGDTLVTQWNEAVSASRAFGYATYHITPSDHTVTPEGIDLPSSSEDTRPGEDGFTYTIREYESSKPGDREG